MARSKAAILAALDITRQLYTWDSKLHKDVFTRHLKNYLDQSKLSPNEHSEVLNIIENILYVTTDKKRYISIDENIGATDMKEVMGRIYDVKTRKNGYTDYRDWEDVEKYDIKNNNKDIAKELFQLKIRLHEEIVSVKNDIKICKQFIKQSFEQPKKSARSHSIGSAATPRKWNGSSSNSLKAKTGIPRSNSSSSLNINSMTSLAVKRRGSSTSLLEELNKSNDQLTVNILLGDFVFDQISSKRLTVDNSKRLEPLCKSNYTVETGFDKLTDFVINNPKVEVAAVCMLLGSNNLMQKHCLPTELALNMMSHIKDLLKRINGQIYVYALLPRLDDATMDRKALHFNSQLGTALYEARLPRVTFMQKVVPRETRCFQPDGLHLAGPGLNKLLRAVRKNMVGEK